MGSFLRVLVGVVFEIQLPETLNSRDPTLRTLVDLLLPLPSPELSSGPWARSQKERS